MYCVKCGLKLKVGNLYVLDNGRPAHIICPKDREYCEDCGQPTYVLCHHTRERMFVVTSDTQGTP